MVYIISADAGEIVVCNAVFRLSISCSVPEIFAIEVRSRPEIAPKCFLSTNFLGEDPQILDPVFKIAPISDHVAKFCSDRPRAVAALAIDKVGPTVFVQGLPLGQEGKSKITEILNMFNHMTFACYN